MQPSSLPIIIRSLDEVCGEGAEALITSARRSNLLHGLAIGIVRKDQAFIRLYGEVAPDSLFEIGSVTKTFTAALLANLVASGTVQLEDPVARYLPCGMHWQAPRHPITLLDLATHRSGEPRLPNLNPAHSDPYATYTDDDLEAYLRTRPLAAPAAKRFAYSNLGFTILGYVLAKASGLSYQDLLQREMLSPLQMHDTALALGQSQPRLLKGFTQSGLAARHWDLERVCPVRWAVLHNHRPDQVAAVAAPTARLCASATSSGCSWRSRRTWMDAPRLRIMLAQRRYGGVQQLSSDQREMRHRARHPQSAKFTATRQRDWRHFRSSNGRGSHRAAPRRLR